MTVNYARETEPAETVYIRDIQAVLIFLLTSA